MADEIPSAGEPVAVKGHQAKRRAPRKTVTDGDVKAVRIAELPERDADSSRRMPRSLLDPVRLELSVELGRTWLSFRELEELSQGAVVMLDHMLGEPLDVRVNGCLVARGEVVAVKDERYGLRITELVRAEQPAGEDR